MLTCKTKQKMFNMVSDFNKRTMRKLIIIYLLLIPASGLLAQDNSIYKFWIEFTDKDDTPYSTDQPGECL